MPLFVKTHVGSLQDALRSAAANAEDFVPSTEILLSKRDRHGRPSWRRRRSSPIERPWCRGRPALARPLNVSHRAHHGAMWNVHRRSGTVELCRRADGQVVMEQTRPSDGGGDVGRPWPERASSRSRAGKRSLGARQTPVLAVDISLPRHHDYRQVELVRPCGYKWLVKLWLGGSGWLCFQRC